MDNTLRIAVYSTNDEDLTTATLHIGDLAPVPLLLGTADYDRLIAAGFFVRPGDYVDLEGCWNRSRTYIPAPNGNKHTAEQHVQDANLLVKAEHSLRLARDTIQNWHGLYETANEAAMWDAYQSSPEMRRINSCLALLQQRNEQIIARFNESK